MPEKPKLVNICCVCGLIRDKTLPYDDFDPHKWREPTQEEQWIIENEPGRLSHGYCPKCAEEYFGWDMGTLKRNYEKTMRTNHALCLSKTIFLVG